MLAGKNPPSYYHIYRCKYAGFFIKKRAIASSEAFNANGDIRVLYLIFSRMETRTNICTLTRQSSYVGIQWRNWLCGDWVTPGGGEMM